METWEGLLLAIGWFLLRFGLPILGTALVVFLFKQLDHRWQRETIDRRASLGASAMLPIVQCWAENNCPTEKCQNCVAFQDQGKPCWQHYRAKDGTLKEECFDCRVFLGAVAPATGD
jgi:hypothetical protein